MIVEKNIRIEIGGGDLFMGESETSLLSSVAELARIAMDDPSHQHLYSTLETHRIKAFLSRLFEACA